MTQEEVLIIMGEPGNRQFNGDDEAWQYFDLGFFTDTYTVIWFYREIVTGISSYTDGGSTLTGHYRMVDW